MTIDSLILKELKEINNFFSNAKASADISLGKTMIGKICIIRTYSAGIHIGKVVDVCGTEVILAHSRNLWKWQGAFTLREIAENGINVKESRISIALTHNHYISQVIEILECSQKCIDDINQCHE